jgi:hypothetical protein
MKNSLRLLGMTMLLALAVGVSGHLKGLQAQTQDPHHPDQGRAAAPAAPSEQRHGMMNHNMTKMMGEMKAADAKLDALVQAMNAAKGAEKTDAIAAVVTALVEQRGSMHSSMASMMDMLGMMNQMSGPASAAPHKPKP